MDTSRKVLIYEAEADRLARFALQYPDIETGGDLFGYWTHSGSPIVSYVTGPGLNCRRTATSFYQDEKYLYEVGTTLYDIHGLQHVGEWHSHHRLGLNEPSGGDKSTVCSGMAKKDWPRFLLLIATLGDAAVLHNYFLFTQGRAPEPLRILQLPGASPFRTSAIDARAEPLVVEHATWRPGPFTPGAQLRPIDDVYRGAWFTTLEGRAILRRAAESFTSRGIQFRMLPIDEGQALKLVLPDATLILGSRFPKDPPQWTEGRPPAQLPAWSESIEIAEWYRQAQQAEAPNGGADENQT